jgi:integrase
MARPRTGSIKAAGGVYKLRITVGTDANGKRIQKQTTFKTRAEAEAKLAEISEQENPRSLHELLHRYHDTTRSKRSQRSNNNVQHIIDKHLAPAHRWMVTDINVEHIERLYADIAAAGLSPQTVRHTHHVLAPALRLAVRWGWIDTNPAELVELGPLTRAKVTLPSDEEIFRLLAECNKRGLLGLFVRLALVTGARRGELSALRWPEVDWVNSAITISSSLEDLPGTVVKSPKTAASTRRIGIDPDTLTLLAQHRETTDNDFDYVFGGETPHSPSSWTQKFIRASAAADVKMRLHDLRHWSASALLADRTPVNVVAARLGHARTSTTTDTYGHLLPRDADGALAGVILDRFNGR